MRGLGWGTHVHPWLIHVNVWQKTLQYQPPIKINKLIKKKRGMEIREREGTYIFVELYKFKWLG